MRTATFRPLGVVSVNGLCPWCHCPKGKHSGWCAWRECLPTHQMLDSFVVEDCGFLDLSDFHRFSLWGLKLHGSQPIGSPKLSILCMFMPHSHHLLSHTHKSLYFAPIKERKTYCKFLGCQQTIFGTTCSETCPMLQSTCSFITSGICGATVSLAPGKTYLCSFCRREKKPWNWNFLHFPNVCYNVL